MSLEANFFFFFLRETIFMFIWSRELSLWVRL